MYVCMYVCMDRWRDVWMDVCTHIMICVWVNTRICGCVDVDVLKSTASFEMYMPNSHLSDFCFFG